MFGTCSMNGRYDIWDGKSGMKITFGIHLCRCEDNIKINVTDYVDCIRLARYAVRWQHLAYTVINLGRP
jgi:hypothetical protein